ncbi:MAG: NADH:flavin oxidoreductase [Candidatus Aminicenantes bacterium]|nr:NADH:flavin oxidoreductase [Candidatus Aminicenantes bacterium]NIM81347.1 NADH:flavin oxidoreductase [Candidatus Aminicenantes bacterium]NIN20758.1 NADH:flavin oxidoreductase [Candidatus Aminicenantes bacterium]NIN44536.1 NADH:flavin oxidoreductase [Candidatus Aminicenantes bacterium]NIN87356.1 NADH:flavin oxidoreductase [Candidatus Aminicenantes bacterium]
MISFKPLSVKKFQAMNRFVRSATCEYLADNDGRPGKRFLELYKELSRGNIGIVITGFAYVMPNGKSAPGQTGIYSDDLIPSWKEVTKLFRDSNSIFIMQIVHGGRQVRPKGNPGPIWAPSAVPDSKYKTQPLEMTETQIKEVIDAFIKAAGRTEEAGFNGIQLHVAHGYLLSQFLSPYTNRRTDDYGGDQEKRTRIVVEIIKGIKQTVNEKFIISAKLNGEDFIEGGLTLNQAIESAKLLKDAGLDLIEISGGMAESKLGSVRKDIANIDQEGYFRDHAREIRKEVGIPTASVGGYRTLEFIEQTLRSGDADLISLCRPFIREPDLLLKFKENEIDKASCISCNKCFNLRGVSCWHLV